MATSKKKTTKKKAPTKKKVAKKATAKGKGATYKKGRGPGSGQPPFKPTEEQRQQVDLMIGLGLPYEDIATLTINPTTKKGISTATLQKHFVEELAGGRAKMVRKLYGSAYKSAFSEKPTADMMKIFILKTQCGWTEKQKIEHEVDASTGVLFAPSGMTMKEFDEQTDARNAAKKSPVEDE